MNYKRCINRVAKGTAKHYKKEMDTYDKYTNRITKPNSLSFKFQGITSMHTLYLAEISDLQFLNLWSILSNLQSNAEELKHIMR